MSQMMFVNLKTRLAALFDRMTGRNAALALFLLSVILGLLYVCLYPLNLPLAPDASYYDFLAWNFAQGKGYAENPDSVFIQRPPLYPLIISGVYYLFGHSYFAVRFFQVIINALSVSLIYLIASKVFDKRIALWAGLISCFYPSFIIQAGLVMTETIFVFLIILSALVWLNSLIHSSVKGYALLGILLGLANLTRPTAVLLPAFIILFILLFDRKKFIFKSTTLLLFFSLVSSQLVITNYLRYHNFSPVALGGGPSLWINSKNWDSRIEYDEKGNYAGVYKEFLEVGQGLSPVEKEKKYRQEAFKNISQHPFKYIGAFPGKLWRLYVRPAGYEQLGGRGVNRFKKFCFLLIYGLILIYFLIGAIVSIINRNKMVLICLSVIIYFSLIHILTNPNDPRYHLPAMPFIIILASYGLSKIKIIS